MTGCIFLCAERFVTGSGVEPPAAPPTQLKSEYPPPPRGIWSIELRKREPRFAQNFSKFKKRYNKNYFNT